MNELLCNYAILRFLPYKEIGEFVNVGVVVHCPEIDFFDYKLAKGRSRIRRFFPELDAAVHKAALQAVERELKRHRNVEQLFAEGRVPDEAEIARGLTTFRNLLRRQEALLHFAQPGTLLADPRDAVKELFERYVERRFAQEYQYQEMVMQRRLGQWLNEWGLRQAYREQVIGDQMFHLRLPFVHLEQDRPVKAIKPLDLIREEPTKVYEHGDLWIQRVNRLEQRKHLPEHMIFAVRLPAAGETRQAAEEVVRDLQRDHVETVSFEAQDQLHQLAAV